MYGAGDVERCERRHRHGGGGGGGGGGLGVHTVAATAVATGHHMLKVQGYSRLKATHGENGSYIESSAFEVGGHTWRIVCYLNGNTKEDAAGFVSLYLKNLCNDSVVVLAEYELALVRHQGTPPATAYGHQQGTLIKKSEGLRTFGGDNCGWGHRKFISVKELERSRFLKDDCFAVRCTVTVVEERTTVEEKVVVPAHDMARLGLGMLCECDDDLCKRDHACRPAETNFLEKFANFCYSICRGPV
ncbi:BTB/POZ and MATH domain-containing protein 3 [Sorghum bicolor]|uniref:BTB/POZ and MATH domain-containing protein 3 n=1 Tax=Sorghum bicolor TaxID=4558 RepID=UPI000B424093|nr:BTB/POZ and MATH domain-containing protein 3 [Sorghum bicolor]|eukprot:XP_002459324.2 BTB/POZ and MATH domain-containing protein 3 [Sorghum bicolor]